MELNIVLYNNDNPNKAAFIKLIHNCVNEGCDLMKNEIRTWKRAGFTNKEGDKEFGFKHSGTQFEDNGWITLSPSILGVKALLRKSSQKETTREQEALILLRFATMLRNHFAAQIRAITLFGL